MTDKTQVALELLVALVFVLAGGWAGTWLANRVRERILRKHIEDVLEKLERVQELERRNWDVE